MQLEDFSLAKHFVHVGGARIAYHDKGSGQPVLLLHGCPFSSFVWRKVSTRMAGSFPVHRPRPARPGRHRDPN